MLQCRCITHTMLIMYILEAHFSYQLYGSEADSLFLCYKLSLIKGFGEEKQQEEGKRRVSSLPTGTIVFLKSRNWCLQAASWRRPFTSSACLRAALATKIHYYHIHYQLLPRSDVLASSTSFSCILPFLELQSHFLQH